MKRIALVVLLLTSFASATVTVNATLKDAQGNPLQFAFIKLHLNYCGYNVPQVPSQPFSMVAKDLTLTPSQLPATIYANNEITCGGSYSTLWHATAYLDSSTPIVGDADFDMCSSSTNCASGTVTLSWNLATAQPFTPTGTNPPPPGYIGIFGNPTGSQTISQPAASSLFVSGTLDLTNATVVGFGNGAGNPASPNFSLQFNSGNAFAGVPNSAVNPSTGQITLNPTGVFTNAGSNLYMLSQVGSIGPSTVFGSLGYPYETDAFTGIATLPVGATQHQANGIAGFGFTNATSSPLGTTVNAVGVFGVGQALVSNSAAWGGNFGCSVASNTTGNLCIGHEVDMAAGANTSPTRFQAFFATGGALSPTLTMPAGPVMGTLNVASNSASVYGAAFTGTTGTNPQFPVTFWSARGTAPIGLMLDVSTYTGAGNSQSIQQGSSNGSTIFTYTQTLNQKGEEVFQTTGTGVGLQPPSSVFASLSGSATNGTYLFCSDCTNTADDLHTAGASCAGSGHGAMAIRQNGAWRCY